MAWVAVSKQGQDFFPCPSQLERRMKITIMVGQIHLLRFLFVVAASRSSLEENYLGTMSL